MNHPFLSICSPFLLCGCLEAVAAAAPSGSQVAAGARGVSYAALIESHCADCHDSTTHKAGLDLSRLASPGVNRGEDSVWERVFDRVEAGEMPPKKRDQPSAKERASFLSSLSQQLTSNLQRRHAEFGRAPVRRMNRTEYETTVHDLFGITAPLKEFFPEDNTVAGFDRVASGLETSPLHLVSYQKAADRALEAAVPVYPVQKLTRRWTGLQFFESRPKGNQNGTRPYVWFENETILFAARTYKHGSIMTPVASMPGRYRIRASVGAVNTEGKSLPVLVGKISSDRFQHEKLEHVLDYRDAPAGRRAVIEVEASLPQGEQVYLECPTFTLFGAFSKERNGAPVEDNYPGPSLAVDWIELEGPLDGNTGYRRIFQDLPWVPARNVLDALAGKALAEDWLKWPVNGGNSEYTNHPLTVYSPTPEADASRLLKDFLTRAFRRPVSGELVAEFFEGFKRSMATGASFDTAMRETCKAALCSPHFFLYLEQPGRLDGFALAARLSRLLWSSQPDETLTQAAASGRLLKPAELKTQTERLLQDARAERFLGDFTGQWLETRRFLEMKPDNLYAEYDDLLAWSMPMETRRFMAEMLAQNRPVTDLVNSNWTFLNGRLAAHYGLGDSGRVELVRVALPPEAHRGGVLTQGAILKVTTNASYTSPVKRGAWVLERILGKTPPAPPADVAAVDPDIRGAVTIREQLALHKNNETCAACHQFIDPPGFALENFDVLGGWRDFYRVRQPPKDGWQAELANYPGKKVWFAKPVEAWGSTPEGASFGDIDEYRKLLAAEPRQLLRNMVRQLVVYATGERVCFADRPEVERIVESVAKQGGGLRTLLLEVVQSPLFCNK
jgi:hypothetical protein